MSHYRQPLHCALHSTDVVLHYAQYHIALCTACADIWTVCTISYCTVHCIELILKCIVHNIILHYPMHYTNILTFAVQTDLCVSLQLKCINMCARVRIIVELRKRLVGKTAGHFPILTSTVCWSQFLQKSFKIYQKLSKILQNLPKDTKTFDFVNSLVLNLYLRYKTDWSSHIWILK